MRLSAAVIAYALAACASAPPPPCTCLDSATALAKPPVPEEPAMTRIEARKVLAKLTPDERARLEQLWFLYDLQDAEGSEGYPTRMLARLEAELANPLVVDAAQMTAAIDQARQIQATLPHGKSGQEWDETRTLLAPVMPLVPPPGVLERRIMALPGDVALAWFVDQYYSSSHYHPYRMHDRLFLLITSNFGRRALAVVEHRLGEGSPHYAVNHVSGYAWKQATDAAKQILGRGFARWYHSLVGASYEDDLRAQRQADEDYNK